MTGDLQVQTSIVGDEDEVADKVTQEKAKDYPNLEGPQRGQDDLPITAWGRTQTCRGTLVPAVRAQFLDVEFPGW